MASWTWTRTQSRKLVGRKGEGPVRNIAELLRKGLNCWTAGDWENEGLRSVTCRKAGYGSEYRRAWAKIKGSRRDRMQVYPDLFEHLDLQTVRVHALQTT